MAFYYKYIFFIVYHVISSCSFLEDRLGRRESEHHILFTVIIIISIFFLIIIIFTFVIFTTVTAAGRHLLSPRVCLCLVGPLLTSIFVLQFEK